MKPVNLEERNTLHPLEKGCFRLTTVLCLPLAWVLGRDQGEEWFGEADEFCETRYRLMSRRHQRSFNVIFRTPAPTTLKWRQIGFLFVACWAKSITRKGSTMRF